jgi:nicotinate-nucleotide adenylyltransferase
MRVGVFGGTFDPIHYGHLLAAEEAHWRLGLAEVLFAPAAQPPHKPGQPISAAEQRVAMVELAIAGNPHFRLSRVDLDRPGPHYTVDTIPLLQSELGPEAELYLIIGLDSLVKLHTWREPARLIRLCRLVVVSRPGQQLALGELEATMPGIGERLHLLETPPIGIAAEDLRRRVREGQSIKYQVPQAVEEYIYAYGLYTAH